MCKNKQEIGFFSFFNGHGCPSQFMRNLTNLLSGLIKGTIHATMPGLWRFFFLQSDLKNRTLLIMWRAISPTNRTSSRKGREVSYFLQFACFCNYAPQGVRVGPDQAALLNGGINNFFQQDPGMHTKAPCRVSCKAHPDCSSR